MNDPLSGAAGLAFAAGFKALKALRPVRPIHPVGVALTGTIARQPGTQKSGIAWADTAGNDAVSARFSRSIGTPPGWPDILGLALRISTDPGPADVLLASTGLSRPGRFVLTAHRHASNSKLTSFMPYQGSAGPVLLAAFPERTGQWLPAGPEAFRRALGGATWTLGLYHARPAGPWLRFGSLALTLDPTTPDLPTRFDPLEHTLPGAGTYGWTRRLRKPSYEAARA